MEAFAERVGKAKGVVSRIISGKRSIKLELADQWATSLRLSAGERRRFLQLAAITHLPKEAQPQFIGLLEDLDRLRAQVK